jgi:hypothetical protein
MGAHAIVSGVVDESSVRKAVREIGEPAATRRRHGD